VSQTTPLSLPALEPLYATLASAAEAELTALPGPLQAELWTSQQLGVLESAAPHEEGYRRAAGDLVQYLGGAGTPGAALLLRAIAVLGPPWIRSAIPAVQAGDLPGWAEDLGRVVPGETLLLQDGSLGGDQIGCEFRHTGGGPAHAILVRLEHDRPTRALVIGDVPGMRGQIAKAVEAEECVLLGIGPVVAGRRLRAAYEARPADDLIPTAALVRHRIAALGS
jgi:hypothetical protein